MTEKKVQGGILAPEHINETLKIMAGKTHRTKSAYIRQILRRYVECLEKKEEPGKRFREWDID